MYFIFPIFLIYFILFIAFGFIFFVLKKNNNHINVDYSVIIPVKNEAENIISSINSILVQSYLPAKFYVDDHSLIMFQQFKIITYEFIKYIKLDKDECGKN